MFRALSVAELQSALHPGGQTAVALGSFDGVHGGHRALLAACSAAALRIEGQALACTFYPHPSRVLRPSAAPKLIESLPMRLARFAEAGLDGALVQPFTPDFAALSPEAFCERWLRAALRAQVVVVGENFRFGRGRAGDAEVLRRLGRAFGFDTHIVEPVLEAGEPISSSRVRRTLEAGDLALTARLLGRPFSITGEVVHGAARGRTLGFPTANVASAADVVPPFGIYAAWAHVPSGVYRAALSIGVHPTFGVAPAPKFEAYLLDYDGPSLYGQVVEVALVARLRGEQTFAEVDALIEQMHRDVHAVAEVLGERPPQAFVPLAALTHLQIPESV